MPTEAAFSRYRIDPAEYSAMTSRGYVLNTYKSLSGEVKHNYVAQPAKPEPRIMIVEKYRLSTYLGQYGAGRTVSTFSLLPGERTTISISTYRRSETSATEASSILDSYTEETASEFEDSVMSENASRQSSQDSFNYHAEAEASASWGAGRASVSGGVSGSTSSAREEFAKSVSSATSRNAARASAKRDVQINTSFTASSQEGEETSITREIRNLNVGRTLNFVFRQMNQEFITLLHLVDVRVAFFNGYRGSAEEFALADLDRLLAKYVKPARHEEVRRTVLAELGALRDWRDQPVGDFVEPFPDARAPLYWRVKRNYLSEYADENGNRLQVPGVITSAVKNVMRTDGVIAEALLGQASALDDYSRSLQDEKNRAQALDNRLKELEVRRAEEQLRILAERDEAAARVYATLYPRPTPASDAVAADEG